MYTLYNFERKNPQKNGFCYKKNAERVILLMIGNDKTAKLQLLLCELKLEQRHVNTDMSRLLKQGKTVDFYQAKQLAGQKVGLAKKISKVEGSINPNIIA